jgi:endoribonuclease Dicer
MLFYTVNVGLYWYIGSDAKADMDAGYLTSKVTCLVDSLLEYRFD